MPTSNPIPINNMTISIQPLDHLSRPIGEPFTSDWRRFVEANEGLPQAEILDALSIGANYLLGGGAAGAYRLTKLLD